MKSLVVTNITFDGTGEDPPTVKVLYQDSDPAFMAAVLKHMSKYRLPCKKMGSPAVTAEHTSVFFVGDGPEPEKSQTLDLLNYLAMTKDAQQLKAYFDFETMACPFDLKVLHRRPFLHNTAIEVGEENINRRNFMEWLAKRELNLTERQSKAVFGSPITVHVPCAVLNLNPSSTAPN